jgi:zinc protease
VIADSNSVVSPSRLSAGRVLLLMLVLCTGTVARAQVHEHRLANGLRILVKEDRRAPVAVSMLWYHAGSMDEVTGATGVAHVLEHMMFKGTAMVPAGEFSRTIARAGGRDNAFTSKDATVYHQQLHRSRLPLAMQLEADRMENLRLTGEEFAREIRVVMEERRLRTEDQPRSLLYEAFLASAYVAHPYRTPIIGWMEDLRNLTVEDAQAWYRTWYAPNNATLVVVGDVEAAAVFGEARKWFGALAPHAVPERKVQHEPVQRGTRRLEVGAPAELPYLLLGWHVPVLRNAQGDEDAYALWVLAAVLDGSEAARLPRELVRADRLAVSANAGYDPVNRGPGLFVLSATPSAGRKVEEVEAALRAQIQRIAREGITAAELARTKRQAMATRVFQRDSMYWQAMDMGALVNAGLPPDFTDIQVRRLQDVTAEQVQAAALKYFGDDNLTVAVLRPQPLPPGAQRRTPEGGAAPNGEIQ